MPNIPEQLTRDHYEAVEVEQPVDVPVKQVDATVAIDVVVVRPRLPLKNYHGRGPGR